ncbi:MAG: ArsA family ATPase [Marmoricola sp.]
MSVTGSGAGAAGPRILLLTGKGGVGKTTAAAGVGALAARRGLRALVLSTDAAHSLADALGASIGSEPTVVGQRLWAQQVDVQQRFEESWGEIQGYLRTVLDAAGVDPITAEELTVLPGAEEVLALLELRAQVTSGRWDVVVVDCAPTGETLRLLALPEALGWYMDRLFGVQRTMVRALRPVLSRAAGVPMPEDSVFAAVERLHADLSEVRALLTGERASVRLVLTPEAVVVAEARRSLTSLSLHGYRVDGVVANRIFPPGEDPWIAGWVAAQSVVLEEVRESFRGLPVWRSTYRPEEPVGPDRLADLAAEVYGEDDPFALPTGPAPLSVERTATGALLCLALPFADRSEVHLGRRGDELVLTVGSHRRLLALPAALARQEVVGARIEQGSLRVRFSLEEADTDD